MSAKDSSPAKAVPAKSTEEAQPSLLTDILKAGRFAKAPERGLDLVDTFVQSVMADSTVLGRDVEATINAQIAQIDRRLSEQLDEILHNEAFQKLEATWRGLRYLLDQTETGQLLKIKVFNITKRELLKNYQKAPEFDQSALFQK